MLSYDYYDDFSFAEIADLKNVSRNAVFDQIKKAINVLEEYEEKLALLKKKNKLMDFSAKLDEASREALLSIIKE